MTALDFAAVLPEFGLAVFALLALLAGAFGGKDKIASGLLWAAVLAMVVAAFVVPLRAAHPDAFGGMFYDDAFARFAKVVILLSSAAVLAASEKYMRQGGHLRFEVSILFVLCTVGMMIMVSSGDLLTLYVGLELSSLSLYILAAMRRDSARSSEAGLKYFVLGALAAGLVLYGSSLVYGFAGTTRFSGIIEVVQDGRLSLGLLFGLVFLLAGLAFKVSSVPFHMWTPDVYEGAPTPITALFITAPKVAGMVLIGRLLYGAFGHVPANWRQLLAAMSALSMFLGAIGGIGQTDFKRMMAYSSIAHMGFAFMGLAAGTADGVQAMLVYMAIYAIMNVGVFAFILTMERDGRPVSDLASLRQYAKDEPMGALALLIIMFSLAGVPPTLGFFAKWSVLWAATSAGLGWLAVLGVIASVIACFYYLRVVYYMYFGEQDEPVATPMGLWQRVVVGGTAIMLVVGSISMFGADNAAIRAAGDLIGAPAEAAVPAALPDAALPGAANGPAPVE